MAEYIEREAALRVLCDACGNAACPKGLIPRCSYYEKMQSVPAADVRPVVRGKWHSQFYYRESTKSYDCEMHVCSECGGEWSYDAETGMSSYNYCPNCGADMRKGGAGNG